MTNEKIILKKLEEHDKILADHSEQLTFIRENMVFREDLEQFATRSDLLATKRDLQEELKHYATKEDLKAEIHALEDRVITALDAQMVILQRLDQERVFTFNHLQRLDGEVLKIKTHLNLS